MHNVRSAVKIAKNKYPAISYTECWIFNQSSCHEAYAEDDALNAKGMTLHTGGAQPQMRDTIWAVKVQHMVMPDATPKGLKTVLEERGSNTAKMKADNMRVVLSFHDEFRTEKTLVKKFFTNERQQVMFLPKFHCELNPIERVWGQAKSYSRQYINHTLQRLHNIINPALGSVSTDLIKKYFRKVGDYERTYIEGEKAGKEVENAVKVYK